MLKYELVCFFHKMVLPDELNHMVQKKIYASGRTILCKDVLQHFPFNCLYSWFDSLRMGWKNHSEKHKDLIHVNQLIRYA